MAEVRVGELAGVEAAQEDRHQESGDLGVGDEMLLGGAVDDGSDEGMDLFVAECVAVALVKDDIDGVDVAHGSR